MHDKNIKIDISESCNIKDNFNYYQNRFEILILILFFIGLSPLQYVQHDYSIFIRPLFIVYSDSSTLNRIKNRFFFQKNSSLESQGHIDLEYCTPVNGFNQS